MKTLLALVVSVASCASLSGCYAAHELAGDPGPRDAGRADAPMRDGAMADARLADAPIDPPPLPSCDLPMARWRRISAEYHERSWAFPQRARFGTTTWIVGAPNAGGDAPLQLSMFDGSAPPSPAPVVDLAATRGGPITAAADEVRIATVASTDEGAFLFVHDPGGSLLSREPIELEVGRLASMSLAATRIGIVRELGTDATIAEVRDVAGGAPFSSTVLDGWVDASIGRGRGSFSFVARSRATGGATSTLFGLDEMGTIPALELDPGYQASSWDGTVLVGFSEGGIGIRHLGGRVEVRSLPMEMAFRDRPSVADGPHGAVVSIATDRRVYLSLPDGSDWIAIDASDRASSPMADTARGRVGTFFVDGTASRGTLRWVGLGCTP